MVVLFYLIYGNMTYLTFGEDTGYLIISNLDESKLHILISFILYLVAAWPGIIETFDPMDELFKAALLIKDDIQSVMSKPPKFYNPRESSSNISLDLPATTANIELKEIPAVPLSEEIKCPEELPPVSIKLETPKQVEQFLEPPAVQARRRKLGIFETAETSQENPSSSQDPNKPSTQDGMNDVIDYNQREKEVEKGKKEEDEGDFANKLTLNVFRFICLCTILFLASGNSDTTLTVFFMLEIAFKTPMSLLLPAYLFLKYSNPTFFQKLTNIWIIALTLTVMIAVTIYNLTPEADEVTA